MAVLLHALLTLVLIDLSFTAFLNRAHGSLRFVVQVEINV